MVNNNRDNLNSILILMYLSVIKVFMYMINRVP